MNNLIINKEVVESNFSMGELKTFAPIGKANANDLHNFSKAVEDLRNKNVIIQSKRLNESSSFEHNHAANSLMPVFSNLQNHLDNRTNNFVNKVTEAVKSRDPAAIMQVTAQMTDVGIENTLIAKVLGKTISAVDQLTKLN